MSGLVRTIEDVADEDVALTCHACGHYHQGDEFDEILDSDPLRCLTCGSSGLIPHAVSPIAERFGPVLGAQFVPIPIRFLEVAGSLGLGPHEILVVVALESYRSTSSGWTWQTTNRLRERTGLSADQLKRATSKLVRLRLAERGRRRSGVSTYNLDRLWDRIGTAHQCTEATEQQRAVEAGGKRMHSAPVRSAHSAKQADRHSAPVRPEIDPSEIDPSEIDPSRAPAVAGVRASDNGRIH